MPNRFLLAGIVIMTMAGTAHAGFLSDLIERNCQTPQCTKNAESLRSLGHSMRDASKAVRPPVPPLAPAPTYQPPVTCVRTGNVVTCN